MKSKLIKFIPTILGGILGLLLVCMGHPIWTWQFWAIVAIAFAIRVYGQLTGE